MSLLAMLADNFKLEQPPDNENENENLLNDDNIAMDLTSAVSSADDDDNKDANNIAAFTTATVASSDATAVDTTFMTANDDDENEYHNVIKHNNNKKAALSSERNNSEGTAETEQSFGSATTNAENGENYDVDDYEEFHRYNNNNVTTTSQSLLSSSLITTATTASKSREMKLILTFVLMVVVGTGMKIFQKLQAIPYVLSLLPSFMIMLLLVTQLTSFFAHLSLSSISASIYS